MRGLRVDRVLTGTALALLMANMLAGSIVARAQDAAENRKEIEALVPLPDAADVPPPSLGDMVGLPMPEPTTVGTIEIPPAEPAPVEPAAATAQPEPSSPAPSQPTTTVSTPPVTEPPAAATAQPEPPSPAPSQPTTTVSTPPVTEPPVAAPAKEPPQPVIAADLSPVDQRSEAHTS